MKKSACVGAAFVGLSTVMAFATAANAVGVVDPECTDTTVVAFDITVPEGPSELSIFNYQFYGKWGFLDPHPLGGSEFTVTNENGEKQSASTEAGIAWQNHPVVAGKNTVLQTILPQPDDASPDKGYWPISVHTPDAFDDYDPNNPFALTIDVQAWQTCQAWLNNARVYELGRSTDDVHASEIEFPDWDLPGWVHDEQRPVSYAYRCDRIEKPVNFGVSSLALDAGLALEELSVQRLEEGSSSEKLAFDSTGSFEGEEIVVDLSTLEAGEYRISAALSYGLQGEYEVSLSTVFMEEARQNVTISIDDDVQCLPPGPGAEPEPKPDPDPDPSENPGVTPNPGTKVPVANKPPLDTRLSATGSNGSPQLLTLGVLALVSGSAVIGGSFALQRRKRLQQRYPSESASGPHPKREDLFSKVNN
ncbi:hypothetical protein JSO19_02495 [Leucobacter sp. UCMA 4100]|uniref:hypothetical protein n=1 Tax=Leucobacter sp. UCMA 4100 TaxID=2810534 RepID=UPI0022EBA2A9|nr:hypothetical protein [Leucobacter sp. UCMA 4100]MDA3146247.1 hypothetical protein [Leucobacter sp. UCMA 4100]